jgi:hypothetical protein
LSNEFIDRHNTSRNQASIIQNKVVEFYVPPDYRPKFKIIVKEIPQQFESTSKLNLFAFSVIMALVFIADQTVNKMRFFLCFIILVSIMRSEIRQFFSMSPLKYPPPRYMDI